MEKKLNIYQKINAVMKEVKVIQKESKKVNGQYTFVSHDAVTGALHMPMAEHGIVMIPTIVELTQDGNRTVAKMDISFVNADDPADRIVVQYFGYGIDPSDKGIGKAVSYAVKYALLKQFCLETGDDVEKDNIHYEPPVMEESVNERKKRLLDSVGKAKKDQVKRFFDEMAVMYKKPIDDLVMKYSDIQKFIDDFTSWEKSLSDEKVA